MTDFENLPETLVVDVTLDHIDNSDTCHAHACVLSIAIKEHFGVFDKYDTTVGVMHDQIRIVDTYYKHDAQAFLEQYDEGKEVQPCKITLVKDTDTSRLRPIKPEPKPKG